MRRLVVLLMAIALAFALVGGTAWAKPGGGKGSDGKGGVEIEPFRTAAAPPSTEGLTSPLPVEDGELRLENDVEPGSPGEESSTPGWQDGAFSVTHWTNPVSGVRQILTNDQVSFWGAPDRSYPKVGELYYGRVVVAEVGTEGTHVVPEVTLPPNTHFAINQNDPNMKIRCFWQNLNNNTSGEFPAAECPQAPSDGSRGKHAFYQPADPNHVWPLPPGWVISVVFPVVSTAELKGIAAAPRGDCLMGAIWASRSDEVWDAPEQGDPHCTSGNTDVDPDGAWQGVWVAPNPPTIQYPSPSATNVTGTGARTTGHLFSHYAPGTVFIDLGTSTQYGDSISGAIPNTQDSFVISGDWTGLKPDTTYHWRLRFVDGQGQVYRGADQTLTTRNTPPTISAMRPSYGSSTTNRKPPISATVRDATTDLAKGDIQLVVDGRSVTTFTYDGASDKLSYVPSRDLSFGKHTVKVVATDARGLSATKSWSFSVVR